MKVLVLPDKQVRLGAPVEHIKAAGNLIVDEKPDVIIDLGDHYDMASLTKYEKPGGTYLEGMRVMDDIQSGHDAMDLLLQPLREFNQKQRDNKTKLYRPDMYFLTGNHEERLNKIAKESAKFEGVFDEVWTTIESFGWTILPFLDVLEVGGVSYSHYFENDKSSHPIGRAHLMMNKRHKSLTCGHQQGLDYFVSPTKVKGKQLQCMIAGSFYMHDEHYKSKLTNTHWNGLIIKDNCAGGEYDPRFIRTSTLLEEYGSEGGED